MLFCSFYRFTDVDVLEFEWNRKYIDHSRDNELLLLSSLLWMLLLFLNISPIKNETHTEMNWWFCRLFYYIATYHKQLQQIMWWVLKSCVYVVFTETGLKCDTTKQKSHSFVSHKSPVFNRKTFKTVDIVVVLMILNQIHS